MQRGITTCERVRRRRVRSMKMRSMNCPFRYGWRGSVVGHAVRVWACNNSPGVRDWLGPSPKSEPMCRALYGHAVARVEWVGGRTLGRCHNHIPSKERQASPLRCKCACRHMLQVVPHTSDLRAASAEGTRPVGPLRPITMRSASQSSWDFCVMKEHVLMVLRLQARHRCQLSRKQHACKAFIVRLAAMFALFDVACFRVAGASACEASSRASIQISRTQSQGSR